MKRRDNRTETILERGPMSILYLRCILIAQMLSKPVKAYQGGFHLLSHRMSEGDAGHAFDTPVQNKKKSAQMFFVVVIVVNDDEYNDAMNKNYRQ